MSADEMRRGNRFTTDEGYRKRVETISTKFEYITADIDSDYIYVRCKDCGTITKKSKVNIKPSRSRLVICDNCNRIIKEAKEKEKTIKQKEARLLKEIEKIKAKIKKIEDTRRTCIRCGKEFYATPNQKYCSNLCARRQHDSNKTFKRRMRAKSQAMDNISLRMLYKRDNGKCWICGGQTKWSDQEKRPDGAFITGNSYPSIDHVIPLAKGGSHTWDNVRLAHRRCNTIKSDNLIIEQEDSQLRFVM